MSAQPASRPRALRARRGWRLPTALALVLAGSLLGVTRAGGALPARGSWVPGAASSVRVTIVGDSLSSGYRTPGDPWTLTAQRELDAERVPIVLANASGAGSGYQARGEFGFTFADWARVGVTSDTAAVVLYGSDNDSLDADYAASIASTLELVHTISARARIVVVGPSATRATPASRLTSLNSTLQQVALASGADFVDAMDWFAGAASKYLGPDGEHPNAAGESYLATRFLPLLRQLTRPDAA